MKSAPVVDPIALLLRLVNGNVPDPVGDAREEEIRGARALAVPALATALERGDVAVSATAAAVAAVDEELRELISKTIAFGVHRMEVLRRDADARHIHDREVERIEHALRAREALPRAVLELEPLLAALGDIKWRGTLPSTWSSAAREAWFADLAVAGEAYNRLQLCLPAPEEVAAVRRLLDGVAPGRWSAQHAALCRPEPAEAEAEVLDRRYQRTF